TTGVKLSPTPNFLNVIVVWQLRPFESQVEPVGIGNSPPARKFALSPEIAVRFGSARVRMTPARSIARNVAFTDLKEPAMALPSTSGCPSAVKGLELLKLSTELP